MSITTLNDIFFAIVDRAHERVMMHRQAIQWVPISSQELYRQVAGVSQALERWGIGKGDRVAILSENRPEWAIADFACQLLGIVSVPIYSTLTPEQSAFILKDEECRAVFVSSERLLRKGQSTRAQTLVEKIVVMDSVETNQAFQMAQLMHEGPPGAIPGLTRARTIVPDDLATLLYTSGATGVSRA
jgi:long-chain acyl-CoA synthetase